jgi:hypothetical protein
VTVKYDFPYFTLEPEGKIWVFMFYFGLRDRLRRKWPENKNAGRRNPLPAFARTSGGGEKFLEEENWAKV